MRQDASVGNAGLGSNLTVKGAVECDASIMAGDGAFGAVGAVSGVLLVMPSSGTRTVVSGDAVRTAGG